MSQFRELKDTLEGSPDYIRLRLENPGETVATPVSVSSISVRVIEYANERAAREDSNGTEILEATNLTPVADYIFSPVRSWSLDTEGYNFEYLSPGTNRPNGNKWIRHQFTITPATGPAYMSVTINKVLAVND
jgi:hypothetical protein